MPGFPVPFPDQAGDIPVPADYDGNGKADVAFFRPGSGLWFGQQSENLQRGPHLILGNQQGDVPIPCDYDGDRKTDVAIFRPAVIARPSVGGTSIIKAFGTAPGDVPVGKRPSLPGYPYNPVQVQPSQVRPAESPLPSPATPRRPEQGR